MWVRCWSDKGMLRGVSNYVSTLVLLAYEDYVLPQMYPLYGTIIFRTACWTKCALFEMLHYTRTTNCKWIHEERIEKEEKSYSIKLSYCSLLYFWIWIFSLLYFFSFCITLHNSDPSNANNHKYLWHYCAISYCRHMCRSCIVLYM